MQTARTWLRISYWTGALLDGVCAVVMFAEAALGRSSPLTGYVPETPYRYAIGLAGSLMLGWTLLLVWADRRPLERRGVLLLTCVVVLGLGTCSFFAAAGGFLPTPAAPLVLAVSLGLILLFAGSYVLARRGSTER